MASWYSASILAHASFTPTTTSSCPFSPRSLPSSVPSKQPPSTTAPASQPALAFEHMYKFTQSELEELEQTLCAKGDVSEFWPWSRLHHAAFDGDLARMKLLLRFGANVDARNAEGQHPMHVVVGMRGGYTDRETRGEAVKLLLAAGADPNARDAEEDTPLSLAYGYDCAYCFHALIDADADPSIFGRQGAPTPTFAVDLIRNPDGAEVVANILAVGADVNARDNRGHTLLDRAAFCGSPSAVRALLDAGADANAETRCPPLCSAAVLMKNNGGEEAVIALIRAGAALPSRCRLSYNPPLHRAVKYHSLVAIRLLLDSGADPNLPSLGKFGLTPLCVAVAYARDDDDCDIIKALLQGGADVNGREDAENRPLHEASERGHASTVRLLLELGADPPLRGSNGRTALHRAARGRGRTVLLLATTSALLEVGADPNAQDNSGETPLHDALRLQRSFEHIHLLLKAGADPRIHGRHGSALHTALGSARTATILTALLDAGADPNARDGDDNGIGETPLHHTVKHYYREPRSCRF